MRINCKIVMKVNVVYNCNSNNNYYYLAKLFPLYNIRTGIAQQCSINENTFPRRFYHISRTVGVLIIENEIFGVCFCVHLSAFGIINGIRLKAEAFRTSVIFLVMNDSLAVSLSVKDREGGRRPGKNWDTTVTLSL